MSSLTDRRTTTAAAGRRLSAAGVLGFAALAGVMALLAVFIWQAGVLAPPAPQDVASNDVVEKPEQITSTNARISGRDKNDRPFEIRAKSGEQDKTIDSLVHMNAVSSVFERPSGAKLDVTSQGGQFDRKTKALELSGDVVFREGERFRAVMDKAAIDTENQSISSQSPVKVDMRGTMIEADSLKVTENGTRILFKGRVKATFVQKDKSTGDGE
jgi:lipopolysaccharide export system protein LptC